MNFTRTLRPLSMLLLSGCVVGPDYQKPETALPAKFTESKATSADNVALNPWWEAFRDKRLNALVHEGLGENLSVMTALERIEAAEASVTIAGAGSLPSLGVGANATAQGGHNAQLVLGGNPGKDRNGIYPLLQGGLVHGLQLLPG